VRFKTTIGREEGFVIIAVLWLCALIVWLALQIATDTRMQGEEQLHLLRKSQAFHLAIGGCYEAIARMGQSRPTGLELRRGKNQEDDESWQPDGVPHVIKYGTGEAVVVVQSESLKVNVNKANHDQLKAVLEKAGMDQDAAEGLSDVIADFVDGDDTVRLRGAEQESYQRLGLSYGPFNGPLTSLDQLLLIPGVTQQFFFGYGQADTSADEYESELLNDPLFPREHSLFDMFTVYGSNVQLREDDPSTGVQQRIITWKGGDIYRILSSGKPSAGSPSVLVWLIVRYVPQSKEGFEILYRKTL
jgi:hypothetical protein